MADSEATADGHADAPARARVLIVDDMSENIELLAAALEGAYEVFFATSGEEAIRIAVTQRVELILLDIMMPDVDGYEVCRLLKLDPALAEIPVLFVTAKTGVEDESKGFAVGAVDYITKPITPLLVQARVRTHLELRAVRERLKSMAAVDVLTGIPNRPAFDEVLARELQRTRVDAAPLTLMLLGLDDFRAFNDSVGYRAGDRCLQQLARLLQRRSARALDFSARYAAAVFGLVCPDTDRAQAEDLARDLLSRVAGLAPVVGDGPSRLALTASISGITLEGGAAGPGAAPPSAERVAEEAERLLAKAQRAGHNQLWIASWSDLLA
jgi:diguanylate cyclase (GGDEF)-like protein